MPVTVKGNPFSGLFNPSAGWPDAAYFETWFTSNLDSLLADKVTGIRLAVPNVFNPGQSQSSGSDENRYLTQLGTAPERLPQCDRIAADRARESCVRG